MCYRVRVLWRWEKGGEKVDCQLSNSEAKTVYFKVPIVAGSSGEIAIFAAVCKPGHKWSKVKSRCQLGPLANAKSTVPIIVCTPY